jgi:hypothetical protein
MKVIFDTQKKALYIIFSVDAAHVDSSLADIWTILQGLMQSELFNPIYKAYLAIKKTHGESKNMILQSTATKGIKKL